MDAAEFDKFADEYRAAHAASISFSGEEPEYFAEYKIAALARFVASRGAGARAILDFGAGVGNSVPFFRRYFVASSLTCADASARSLAVARERFPGDEVHAVVEGPRLPFDDDRFDLAFSACVFHHIPHDEHERWLRELLRTTRPGGLLAVFEHNPWNPLTLHAVERCAFDENARLVAAPTLARRARAAGWRRVEVRYHLFFPRRLARMRVLEPRLAWLPMGGQYSLVAEKAR